MKEFIHIYKHLLTSYPQLLKKEDKEKLKKYSVVLYEQARILAGLNIENPTEFVKAFSDII